MNVMARLSETPLEHSETHYLHFQILKLKELFQRAKTERRRKERNLNHETADENEELNFGNHDLSQIAV